METTPPDTTNTNFKISQEPLEKQYKTVLGRQMAYHEVGTGDPVVFLHGNPTSSYLWRNVVPHVSPLARCIVPDLIGQGDSSKLDESGPDSYTFAEHRGFLDDLLEQLDLGDKVTFVIHDWGSALGFDWANRHRDRVAGIAYMEAIVRPVSWDEWPEKARGIFQSLRSSAGEEMVLKKNLFVEAILPASILRKLDNAEMDEYRRPFAEPGEGRRPTLSWPRQIPIEGEPQNVVEIVQTYADWLSGAEVPKLFVNAEPGSILTGAPREFARSWPNQTEVTVSGSHFIQEDSPDEIGNAIADWLQSSVLPGRGSQA
jgi:haloalkane dehalogenase